LAMLPPGAYDEEVRLPVGIYVWPSTQAASMQANKAML